MIRRALWAVVFLSLASWAAPAHAQPVQLLPKQLVGVEIEQHLDAQVPLDLAFRDEAGKTVRLADLVQSRPVVLNLVYYRCPMLCTLVVNGLLSSFRALPFTVGREFDVITVSIDPREGPELAAAKKKNVLDDYGRPGAESGWHFLTGDETSVRRLADSVGFSYTYDAESDTFAHAAGVMILTPHGRVSRYLFGVEYAPKDMRLSLVEASNNKIGTVADQILLFCYHYDPSTGRYSVAALNLVRAGGILTVAALGAFILLAWRREVRRAAASIRPTEAPR